MNSVGIRVDSKKIKKRIILEEEKVRIRRVFSIRIRNKNILGDWFLMNEENLAIIINLEIHNVNNKRGIFKKSKNSLLLNIMGNIKGGSKNNRD